MDAVEICNAALDQLGSDRITSLEDESVLAELCAARFPAVRDAVLGERAWRFAIQRLEIAADASEPIYGYACRYALPSTVVQVLEASDGFDPLKDWQREGAFILTDTEGPIYVRAVCEVEDVSLWPPGFAQAVTTRLAADMCVSITEDKGRADTLWQRYRLHLREAIAADGMQGAHQTRATYAVNRWRA